ncbi:MAG: phosphoribosylformylglycinamidine synthase I [Planctomycetota bacterium]
MGNVRVLVLRAAGINCEEEIVHGWCLAGAEATLLHVTKLAEKPALLNDYQILTIPGGFSYGDDIAAGTILAQRLTLELEDSIRQFVDRGGGVLGVCNGFQVLVKAGLLPGGKWDRDRVTITHNDSAKFEARWVRLRVCTARCAFLRNGEILEMPVEHGEGKVMTAGEGTAAALDSQGRIALRYVDANGWHGQYPANPNGSVDGIAGLCDATGRVFGLMPHPDRHLDHTQHPLWTRRRLKPKEPPDGLKVFIQAVEYWRRG